MNKRALVGNIIMAFICLIGIVWCVIEATNEEMVNTGNKVPCVDDNRREFVDELCIEKIRCTNLDFSLSLAFDLVKHCDDVLGRLGEQDG